MEQFAVYLLKSNLYLAAFASIYWVFLKNETFYRFNRYFLLAGLFCSLSLPFYTYTYTVSLQASYSDLLTTRQPSATPNTIAFWIYAMVGIYAAGCFFVIGRHWIGLMKLKVIVSRQGYTSIDGYKLVKTPVFKNSFSIFNYIIIDNSVQISHVEQRLILAHEVAHVKQRHWIDLLIVQLFCAIQWFSPFSWLYLSIVKQNHEYLADAAVLAKGNSAAVYKAALINHSLGSPVFALASPFANFDKLKRLKMIMRPASAPCKKYAALLAIPALATFLWAFAEPEFVIDSVKTKPGKKLVLIEKPVPVKPEQKVELKAAVKSVLKRKPALKPKEKAVRPKHLEKSVERIVLPSGQEEIKQAPPLYLLDGVEVANIIGLNTENIAAIHVLKGHAAKTYGEKGANGVVLITSKSPEKNDGWKINEH